MKYLKYLGLSIGVLALFLGGNILLDKKVENKVKNKSFGYNGEIVQPYNLVTDSTTTPATSTNWFGSIRPAGDNVYDLGSSSLRWRNIYAGGTISAGTGTFSNLTVTVLVTSSQFSYVPVNTTSHAARVFIQGAGTENPFTIVSSTNASLFTVLTNGNIGINSSTPNAQLSIVGTGNTSTTWPFNINNVSSSLSLRIQDDGSMVVDSGAIYHDGTAKVTYVNSLETGNLNLPDDAGEVLLVDEVNSSSPANTSLGYGFGLNSMWVGGPWTLASGVGTSYNNMWRWGSVQGNTTTVLTTSSTLRVYGFPAVSSTYVFSQKISYMTTSTIGGTSEGFYNYGSFNSLVSVVVTSTGAYVEGWVNTTIVNSSSSIQYGYARSGNTIIVQGIVPSGAPVAWEVEPPQITVVQSL